MVSKETNANSVSNIECDTNHISTHFCSDALATDASIGVLSELGGTLTKNNNEQHTWRTLE